MDKTFFYIIQRDNQIHEIEYTDERFAQALEQWQKGGLIVFPTLGKGINGVDIKNIYNEENYKSYIDTANDIKTFIRKGSWYEIKDRNVPVRHEKWKQDYLNSIKRIPSKPDAAWVKPSPEYMAKLKADLANIFKRN